MLKGRILFITLCTIITPIAIGLGGCTSDVKSDKPKLTIMVPPFQNLGNSNDQDYIAIGIADEMARKLRYTNHYDVIDSSFLLKKIELRQLIGGADDEEKLINEMEALSAQYALRGNYKVSVNEELLTLNVKMLRISDKTEVANITEKGELKHWNNLRAMLTIRLSKELNIPMTTKEIAMLRDVETEDFFAFRDNYLGKLYYYKTLDSRIQKKEKEVAKYRELSIQHFSKSIVADLSYTIPRRNYAAGFDFAKLVSTKEEKRRRVQGRLNEMSIFGLKNNNEARKNISEWVERNNELIRSLINGLPVEYYLEVQGHNDSITPSSRSSYYAKQVHDQLLKIGIFKEKLRYNGYGSAMRIPWVEPNNDSNNRVTFEIKIIR